MLKLKWSRMMMISLLHLLEEMEVALKQLTVHLIKKMLALHQLEEQLELEQASQVSVLLMLEAHQPELAVQLVFVLALELVVD